MFTAVITAMREDEVETRCRPELVHRITELRELKSAVAAYEARVVQAIDSLSDAGLDGRGVLRSHGRVSSKSAARASSTAHGLADLPRASASLSAGRITIEHANALVRAAEDVDPEAVDAELVGVAESGPADIFAKRAREWVNDRKPRPTPGDHNAQREARFLRRWDDTDTGLRMFLLGLDQITAKDVESELDRLERQFWNDDGGRDSDPAQTRTRDQRLADAAVELFTGSRRSADTPPHPKHNVTAVLDISSLTTGDGEPLATLVQDGQPLPTEVLDRMLCLGTVTPVLFDGPSRPIWVGRDHRSATLAQWRVLMARDRGCVGCGADPSRCEAHHIDFWEHFGATDIDNLVLVCSRCHHDLHDRGHTLEVENGRWVIRPPGAPPPGEPGTVTNFPNRDFPTGPDEPHLPKAS